MRLEEEIVDWLAQAAKKGQDRTQVDVLDLLLLSYGRVVLKECRAEGVLDTSRYPSRDLDHVTDWLMTSRARGEPWLERVDAKGRQLKLLKFGSVAQIVNEADKAGARWRSAAPAVQDAEGVRTVFDAGDGWRLVRMTTPEALDHEGRVMAHCVGEGYDNVLQTNFGAFYSLRDPFGKSRLTIEIDAVAENVEQIRGRGNSMPKPEYLRRLTGWPGWPANGAAEELPHGFLFDRNAKLVELAALKPGDVIDADLSFRFADEDVCAIPIPSGVTVSGNVTVKGSDIMYRVLRSSSEDIARLSSVKFNDGVRVNGVLALEGIVVEGQDFDCSELHVVRSQVSCLSETVAGRVVFRSVSFDAPLKSTFLGNVKILDCTKVWIDPEAQFLGNLEVKSCQRPDARPVKFGPSVLVHGDLTIDRSLVTFDRDIRCARNMKITNCDYVLMPGRVAVGGDFTMEECGVSDWPSVWAVEGKTTFWGVGNEAEHSRRSGTGVFRA